MNKIRNWLNEKEWDKLLKNTYPSVTKEELSLIEWLKENNILDDLCNFCTQKNALNRLTSGILGWTWEQEFKKECEKLGYEVEDAPHGASYDFIVNGNKVQCKYTSSKKDRVDIRNKNKENGRKYSVTDFKFMALKVNDSIYILPSIWLYDSNTNNSLRGSILISSHYNVKDDWTCLK